MSINSVTITGNLTRDVDLRTTKTGTSIAEFCVAVNERVKQGDEWSDYANFITCTLWGKRAESLSPYLTKGQKVGIKGRLRYSSWENDDGKRQSTIKVMVEDVELLGAKKKETQEEDISDVDIFG